MNTVEASVVMSVIIFAIMFMISFSLTFTRKTNNYLKDEIVREHNSYSFNKKEYYPDELKRIVTNVDFFMNGKEKE